MIANEARLALLTQLGRALGAAATSPETDTPTKRALPAHLYYDGPFEPAMRRRPAVSLAPPTMLDREAWELARRGDDERLRFILARARGRKLRPKPAAATAALSHDPLAKMVELQDGRVREILAAIPGGSWKGR